MTIFEILKELKKGCWYQIPVDFYASATTTVDHSEAGKTLTHHRNHWARQDIKTTFEMDKPIEMPIWDSNERRMVFRNVVKIEMTNEKIKQFKP